MKYFFMKKYIYEIYFYILVTFISFSISSIIFYDVQVLNLYQISKSYYNDIGEYTIYILLNSYEFYSKILISIYSDVLKYDNKSILLWITIAKNLEFKSLTEEAIQLYYSLYIDICSYETYELLSFIKRKVLALSK